MLRAARAAGLTWDTVRFWVNGDRNLERRLKNRKRARDFCPICNPRLCPRKDYYIYLPDPTPLTTPTPF